MNLTLKKSKKIKIGKKGRKTIRAAEWVDQELNDNIKLRIRLNKNWRFARKNNLQKRSKKNIKRNM